MDAVERAVGVYLALYYLSMSVVARGLWRAGRGAVAIAVLLLPLAVYGVWWLAGEHPLQPRRLLVTLALAPALAMPVAAAGVWALEGAPWSQVRRLARSLSTLDAPASRFTRRLLFAASLAGLTWWALAVWDVDRCAEAGDATATRALLTCVLPGLGAWPAIVAGLWRTAHRERRALEGTAHA